MRGVWRGSHPGAGLGGNTAHQHVSMAENNGDRNWRTQRTLKLLGIALFVRFQRGLQLGVARDDKVLRAHAEGGESGVGE